MAAAAVKVRREIVSTVVVDTHCADIYGITEVVVVAEMVDGAVTVVTESREESAVVILLLGAAKRLSLLPLQKNIHLS